MCWQARLAVSASVVVGNFAEGHASVGACKGAVDQATKHLAAPWPFWWLAGSTARLDICSFCMTAICLLRGEDDRALSRRVIGGWGAGRHGRET